MGIQIMGGVWLVKVVVLGFLSKQPNFSADVVWTKAAKDEIAHENRAQTTKSDCWVMMKKKQKKTKKTQSKKGWGWS